MTLKTVTVEQARKMIAGGAKLIDIREADEHARENIPGADHHALSSFPASVDAQGAPALIFHCKAGSRTAANAGMLSMASPCEAYILEGGIDAWKAAGEQISRDASQPIEIMRQVQIVAGSLTLIGVLLGWLVHPGFYALSGFIGAGLTFSGISGTCMMANGLRLMPWNRNAPAAAPRTA
ncbi:DUF2892 domain-containing protein [Parvularcula flava]|uniref:DUF2892 domain-containing protein n=1 Tax=Aquisalinus luteolus TaxID=1566827 RepID=A0A8J3A2K5_9PROT|nr:rhodanese family protein [Aquisalinus luteolus]NHK28370.1 DUF2892 domain-containing protein [Aquisalinus luteolus]GGH98271.1 membrane protein [Aquisalinus luteolus]